MATLNTLTRAGALRAIEANNSPVSEVATDVSNAISALSAVTSTTQELNLVDDLPATVTFTPAAGAVNVCEVTLQAKDAAGANMARTVLLWIYLSDSSAGTGITATTASGAVTAKASSGVDFGPITAKKVLLGQTKTDGSFILSITDTAKTAFYVCAAPLRGGVPSVSAQLITANYG